MQLNSKNNEFYEKLGVEPPTRDTHGTQEELSKKFEQNRHSGHIWQQRGSFVVCTSCPFEHSFSLPTNKILSGTDNEGMPIIQDVKIS